LLPSLKWLAAADNPQLFDFWKAPMIQSLLLKETEKTHLLHSLKSAKRLGEGSAGVSYLTQFRGMHVIYKEFKSTLTSDGRIESEIALAAALRENAAADPALTRLQEVVAITDKPLGVVYLQRDSQREFQSVAKPPSFDSITRDVYPEDRTFSRTVANRILFDVATAALALNKRGIYHGDLYGHNIQYDPKTGAAMLIDLGAAWRVAAGDIASTSRNLDFRAFTVLANELEERIEGETRPAKTGGKATPLRLGSTFAEYLKANQQVVK
jgi:serine/threonine protein kinase